MGHGRFLFCFETDIFVDEMVGVFLGLQLFPAVKSLEQETSWIYSFQWMEMVHFHVTSHVLHGQWFFAKKEDTRKSKTDGFPKRISFSKCMIFQVKHVELQEGVGIEQMGGKLGKLYNCYYPPCYYPP